MTWFSLFLVNICRDESGMFGKGPGYGVALRKVSQIQQKIEGWDVRGSPREISLFYHFLFFYFRDQIFFHAARN